MAGRCRVRRVPRPSREISDPAARDEAAGDFVTDYFGSHLPFVIDRAGRSRPRSPGASGRSPGAPRSPAWGSWPRPGASGPTGAGARSGCCTVRGVSPAALGLKAVLELIVPLTAGAVGGVALAYGLVRWLGPSPDWRPPPCPGRS